MGYSGQGEALDLVNNAQAEIYGVTGGDAARTTCRSRSLSTRPSTRSKRLAAATAQMTGVPTGFSGLDQLTNGLHPGQMIIIAARPAHG